MLPLHYSNFSLEDFLADEYFQQWALQPAPEDERFWEAFLRDHPHRRAIVTQAKDMLRSFRFDEDPAHTSKQVAQVWSRIEATRQASSSIVRQSRGASILPLWRSTGWKRVAAVFIGLLICGAILMYWMRRAPMEQYTTGYGEIKTITLPDQSVAILNGNSTLRYPSEWEADETREVQLEGEAFFKVVHTQNHQKFLVRTSPELMVEVLGTEFVVKNRKSGSRVVLNRGKVKLHLDHKQQNKQLVMRPGELVELVNTVAGYTQKKVNPEQFSSFTQRKILLKDTPIREIVGLLEETYGMQVQVGSSGILDQTISGTIPSDNVNSILFLLSQAFGYHVKREGNRVILAEKPSSP